MREFQDELRLISFGDPVLDEWGNAIRQTIETVLLCSVNSVSRSEFYQASTNGLHPAYTVYIHPFEYDGQKLAMLKGETYSISRTYLSVVDGIEYLELQLVERIGNG